jgi:hypothetical protein
MMNLGTDSIEGLLHLLLILGEEGASSRQPGDLLEKPLVRVPPAVRAPAQDPDGVDGDIGLPRRFESILHRGPATQVHPVAEHEESLAIGNPL